MPIARNYIIVSRVSRSAADRSSVQRKIIEAKSAVDKSTMTSDESVELSLDLHTSHLEMK